MKTGFQSLKLAIAGFVVPYLFVYNPNMLMIDITGLPTNAKEFPLPDVWSIVTVVVTSIIGVIALSAAAEGYFMKSYNLALRLLLAAGALMLIIPEGMTDVIGMVIVLVIMGLQLVQVKQKKNAVSI